jgi:hypothetical protein
MSRRPWWAVLCGARNRLALVPGVGESAQGYRGGDVASLSFRSWLRAGLPSAAHHNLRVTFILIPVFSADFNVAWDPRWGGYTGGA